MPDVQTKFVCAAQKILSSSAFSDLYRDGCCGAEGGRTGLMQKQILLSSVLKLLDAKQTHVGHFGHIFRYAGGRVGTGNDNTYV